MTRLLLALLLLALPVKAEELIGMVDASLVEVIDGDTLVADARPWLGMTVRVSVRLRYIDAPEINGAVCEAEKDLALKAKAKLEELAQGDLLLVEVGPDKYAGRVVARVIAGGQDVGEVLLREGLARLFTGRRESWCDE